MSKARVSRISCERRYSDDSGVEFGCSLNDDSIEFTCVDTVKFPMTELDWLIDSLLCIREILANNKQIERI